MAWDPRTWFSSTPDAVNALPAPTQPPVAGRRRKTYRKRKGSKRGRTGRKSNRT